MKTLEEIKKAKKDLEIEISEKLLNFSKEYDIEIYDTRIENIKTIHLGKTEQVSFTLELRL